MRIFSDVTNKEYKTVEECLAAEKEFNEAKAKAEAEKKALAANREKRAKEVNEALEEVRKAEEKYQKLLRAFLKDYKQYHYTKTEDNADFDSIFALFPSFANLFKI